MAVIHQFTPVLSYGDAISDSILELQSILRSAGHESEVFVEQAHPKVAHLCHPFVRYRPAPDHFQILHFSIGSDINVFVGLSPGRKVLVYHNITPHTYFEQVYPLLAAQCLLGRYQLRLFRDACVLALADSEFNRRELDAYGIAPNAVFPIPVRFEKFDRASTRQDLMDLYRDGRTNWLFVGRVIPNKRVDALIRAFGVYQRYYNPRSRLIIAGTTHGFERYRMRLFDLIRALRLSDVILTDHVALDELVTLYRLADVFVTLSEHEGFCVPLLEAMHGRVPIVAYAAGAVPETLRGGGVALQTQDPYVVAETVHTLMTNDRLRARVLQNQDRALQYYARYPYADMFLRYINAVI
ncbi:MAG: glycosyltransferase [Acidobacteria bacterium]|nr:glycosyltransferase [Acidobacteriota bacterium]MDW7984405.1 glycosyltransferase [Acidobacteriota bacterium]